jgi:hypothetical protein
MMYVFFRVSEIRSWASLQSLKGRILLIANVEEKL